jgi:hypothetical protein
MSRCRVDPSLERIVIDGFAFPLGVYPVEPMQPRPGFRADFEPADGGEAADAGDGGGLAGGKDSGDEAGFGDGGGSGVGGEGQWEEWPDRYVYEIVITAERLEPLVRTLLGLMPGRIYPILDVLGHDAYREVDPYISYDLLGTDRFMDALRRYRGYFFEDGLCGFGAMCDEPFMYLFVDEHKIITVRVQPEHKEKIDRVLAAFDLEIVEEEGGPAGADAASHEHRAVLITAEDRPDLLNEEEITEVLRHEWRLVLNIDPESNVDEEGNDLGITPWRCIVRCQRELGENHGQDGENKSTSQAGDSGLQAGMAGRPRAAGEYFRYLEILLTAGSLRRAEELALDAAEDFTPSDPAAEEWEDAILLECDRVDRETFAQWAATLGEPGAKSSDERIIWKQWIE